jgi:hypothetical protein
MATSSYLAAEDPKVDLAIVEAMVKDLETYIVKEDVYRTIIVRTGSRGHNIRMSGGDLLARLHRLQGERELLTTEEQLRLDQVQEEGARVIYSLRTRFHERLHREMKARLDSLKWFLDDAEQDRQRLRSEFPFEMRNRQRIEEIQKELAGNVPDDLRGRLGQVDRRIRQSAQPSDFIWDERLKKVYPPDQYWFLYMRPAGLGHG